MTSAAKKIRIHGDRIIWLLVIVFAMVSIVVLYSSISTLAFFKQETPLSMTLDQFSSFMIGFGILFVCYLIPIRWWRKFVYPMMLLSIVLLAAVLIIALGAEEPDYRHLLLKVGKFDLPSIQPSELAKISVVLYLGRILEISRMKTFLEYTLKILLPIGVICGLTVIGSFSATLIILTVSAAIIVCAGIKKEFILWTFVVLFAMAGVTAGTYYLSDGKIVLFPREETVINRVERFFSDTEEMTEKQKEKLEKETEQERHAIQAVQIGKIRGVGPGNGHKKNLLSNAYDDYIFACIVEEYGLLGAVFIMLLYIWFFYRCLMIAQACNKTFTLVVTLGLGLLITLQAFIHIFVNTGMIPVTGQTLPLISNGGTSIVILSCGVGVILSISKTIEMTVEKDKVTMRQIEDDTSKPEKDTR